MSATGRHRFGERIEDLDWIDSFADRVRPYVRVRPEDGVLIKVPTEVYELNPGGAEMLARALAGTPAREVARESGAAGHPERIFSIHAFFCDVRDLLSGRMGTGLGRRATRVRRFEGSFTDFPVLSEFALTYRCNLACAFCYAGCGTPGTRPRAEGPELTTADARRVIEILARDALVPSISFTGGECTLRPDLPELVRLARELGLRTNLITNGVRCREPAYPERLAAAGLHSAQVSLEGPDGRVHDRLTRRRGSFEKTLAGVGNLRAAGIRTHVHTTISRENAAHLEAIVDLAADLGLARLSMNLLIPTGTPLLPDHAGLPVPYAEVGPLVLSARARAERRGIDLHWYSPTPFCLFNPVAKGLGNKGCAACDGLIHVAPSGDVLPCSSYPRSVGNLLTDGFAKVWSGRKARYHRRKRHAPAVCRTCEHFALCQGACPLYWDGMGRGELYRAYGKMLVEKARARFLEARA
jgi:radical SAM protein with 4Fe4S-binding SPASM domain